MHEGVDDELARAMPGGPAAALGRDLRNAARREGRRVQAIGGAALRRLVNRLQNPRELVRSILLPPEFKMGETTRQPR